MKVRCSGLARPMVCAGYLFMDVESPPAGEAAEQGTAAGEYLERLLTNQPLGVQASNNIFFDDDMKFHINHVYQEIMSQSPSEVLCETRIDWMTRSGVQIRGQYDACYTLGDMLCIDDLKYGWGIVEVKENWQLLGYAIGEVLRRGQYFPKIRLRILQPRPHHEDGTVREWILTYEELLEYKEKIDARFEEITNGNKTLQTSSKCKYCPAAAEACPAFNRLYYRALEVSTEFVQDSLTEEEISRQLDQIKRAEEVIKIKKDSITELATLRIKNGKIIPNYAQVDKYSNREWKNGITAESLKIMTGGKDLTQTTFVSPAKAEKLGISRKIVNSLTTKKKVGVTLKKQDTTELGNSIFGNVNPLGGNNV